MLDVIPQILSVNVTAIVIKKIVDQAPCPRPMSALKIVVPEMDLF